MKWRETVANHWRVLQATAVLNKLLWCWAADGVRCGVHSHAQNVRGSVQDVRKARDAEQDVRERQASNLMGGDAKRPLK